VPVDGATAGRLRAHDWGSDPFVPTPGATHEFRIRLVDGRCFFLDAQNRCRIHSEVSYDAKPAACRAFPLTVLDVGGSRHARLSYWCPTVVSNTGKPLEHQAQWIKDVSRHAGVRTEPVSVNGGAPLSPRDLEAVHRTLREFHAGPTAIPDRLAAGAGLGARLAAEAGDVAGVLRRAHADGVDALAAEARRGGDAASGRRALALYIVFDAEGGRAKMLLRTAGVFLSGLGLTPVRSRAVGASARWPALRKVRFAPSDAAAEVLARYFASKVESRRYLAGSAPLCAGLNELLVAWGIVRVLAQVRAASERRNACEDGDIRAAVSAADLLVMEHGGLDHGRLHEQLTKAVLASSSLAADVLAAVEG
jgi:hypothetical protein